MKLLMSLLCLLFFSSADAQFFNVSIEPFVGFNYYHSVKSSYEGEPYQGVESNLGVKSYVHIGSHFSVAGAFGVLAISNEEEAYGNVTFKCDFLKNHETGFSCFVETGLEISNYGNAAIPLFLGTNQNFGSGISLNFRLRIPTFADVKYLYEVHHFKIGIELGLEFTIPRFRKPQPLTVFGNPFILN